ncbi:hypothetical protein RSA36_16490 [Pantoea stewartii]|uniref:Uncharacterized protein n=1 Tax=Pantoea stewartii TaxID=66269 RepID=A0AB34VEG0_9GAMM|nr:hypothetical protein RSA30_21500 [Pantoea stewartii]KTS96693.1 hypothetical protein RSA13_13805 [Pantoea stewartii]KTT06170.1 hypothetical protein RSA36_16490 [Pantoea stewartii]
MVYHFFGFVYFTIRLIMAGYLSDFQCTVFKIIYHDINLLFLKHVKKGKRMNANLIFSMM